MKQNHNKNNNSQKEARKNSSLNGVDFLHYTAKEISTSIQKYDNTIPQKTTKLNNLIDKAQNQEIYTKRINSMDSTMLEESAYNILEDSELKLERRIEKIEQNLKEIDEKIIVAETIKDITTLEELNLQKATLQRNLKNAKAEYKTKNIDTQMTSIFASLFMVPYNIKKEIKKHLRCFLFHSKIIKKIRPLARSIMVRDTILKLNKINRSVDELVKMQIPFGEQDTRYEKLINHLSQAGSLHSQIMKELRN